MSCVDLKMKQKVSKIRAISQYLCLPSAWSRKKINDYILKEKSIRVEMRRRIVVKN